MKTAMRRLAALAMVVGCLAGVGAQTRTQLDGILAARGKAVRAPFEVMYPPQNTYAVVVREDLPTVPVKGARESTFPVEMDESGGWKGPGSMFRAKPVGMLALGEVMKVEKVDYSNDRIELRLVSVDPHEIVVDAARPDRNRREQVSTLLVVPHDAGIPQIVRRADAYVRLLVGLEAAREYARAIRDPQPDRRFSLAVVRRDGILVPIANYDNGHWFSRWPLPATDREVPIGLDAIPREWWGIEGRTAKWTLWTPDGQSRAVQVTAPIAFGAHCLMNVGLQTDYHSLLPRPPLDQHHYPKDGLATTGTPTVSDVTVVTAEDSFWAAFERLVEPLVSHLEALLMTRLPPAAWMERSLTPLKLEVLCIGDGAAAGTHTGYFEATRRYAPTDAQPHRDASGRLVPPLDPNTGLPSPSQASGSEACGVVTFAHGWVHRAADGKGTLDSATAAQMTDCSMWDADFSRPLGIVRVDGETIWVMEVSRWGAERYDLVRVTGTSASVVLSTPGGSCRSIGN